MTIQELVSIAEARISYLQSNYSMAAAIGDVNQMGQIESEIMETKNTLTSLKSVNF